MKPLPYLLDTSIVLAATLAPERLPDDIAACLRNPANEVFFSAASIWEIAIKRSLQREDFNFFPEDIQQLALETGFVELPVHAVHCHAVARLPWHHRDPFDRLLVAQAQALPACLLTSDTILPLYSGHVQQLVLRTSQT